jgi:predicted nucleic-acid-binding protein
MTTRTIDTNILVRLLVDDHTAHAERAAEIAARYSLVVIPSVLLETAWVLRSNFRLPRTKVIELLRRVVDFDDFIVVERERVTRAIDCFEKGMDFADAMHVSLMGEGETFLTFDKDLARLAGRHMNSVSVELAL